MNTQNSKNAKPLFWFAGSAGQYARYLSQERGVRESAYRYDPAVRHSSGTVREQAQEIADAPEGEQDEALAAVKQTLQRHAPDPQQPASPDVDRVEFAGPEQEEAAGQIEELIEIYTPRDQKLLSLLRESNDQIRAAAESFEQFYVDFVAVPSAIGYNLKSATNVLKRVGLRVGGVMQEYSETVPEGHVISHVPAAGSQAAKNGLVKVVLSKGKAPEKQKYDNIKQRDTLRMHRDWEEKENDLPMMKLRLVNLAKPGASQIIGALGGAAPCE